MAEREYLVWSNVEFFFSEPHDETKMRARLVRHPKRTEEAP